MPLNINSASHPGNVIWQSENCNFLQRGQKHLFLSPSKCYSRLMEMAISLFFFLLLPFFLFILLSHNKSKSHTQLPPPSSSLPRTTTPLFPFKKKRADLQEYELNTAQQNAIKLSKSPHIKAG